MKRSTASARGGADLAAPLGPGGQEALAAGLHAGRVEPGPAGEDGGGRAEPAAGPADVGPQGGGARQAAPDEGRDPPKRPAQSPPFLDAPRLAATASGPRRSLSPEAASGG